MRRRHEFWCSRRLLVTVDGPQGKSVVPLARPMARIGRQAGSDIVLNSPWVARRSLYLHATDEGVFCFYLQPEEKDTQRLGFWLAPGEPLMVGPYRISAALEGDDGGPAPAQVPLDEWGSAPPPYPVFQVYSGGKLRDKRRFRARLNLIGRRHECALQIKGQQVSSFHGCLFWQYPRLWYIDLVSSNGSSLNGLRVDCTEVRIGDQLEVGEFTLQFQRLSRGGHGHDQPQITLPVGNTAADILPPDFDDDMPLELDDSLPAALADDGPAEADGSLPVIPLETFEERVADSTLAAATLAPDSEAEPAATMPPTESDSALAHVASSTVAARADETALASVQQTRQELAVLQHRVAELTQLTTQAGKTAAQQLAIKTREAFERERQRIAQELARRAAELAQEKQALEQRWQTASRELATQVSQLRDEATLLARQRQAMEQSRLLWDAQRGQLEQQLRAYAQQLARLEQSAPGGLPAPLGTGALSHTGGPVPFLEMASRSATPSEAATNTVLAAAQRGGALTPRSHVVDARVEDPVAASFSGQAPARGLDVSPLAARTLAAPDAGPVAVLEGKLTADAPAPTAATQLPTGDGAAKPMIRGRKSSKGKEAFDVVTDRLVEMEQSRRQKMILLGIAGGVAAVALAGLMIIAAVLLR